MRSLKLTDDEYELIMKLRKSIKKKHSSNSNSYSNYKKKLSYKLRKEIERQEKNMRKIAKLDFRVDPESLYQNSVESSYYRKVRKTVTENGKVYEVTLEDIGDGNGLVEKERKEIGNSNNINYRFSEMTNETTDLGTNKYSKLIKTVNKRGITYEITYEDRGDGRGMVKIQTKVIGKSNKKSKRKRKQNLDLNNVEKEFFKRRNEIRKKIKSKRKNNKLSNSYSYEKKTVIENINGVAYKVTYENVNNTGFKEVKKEKL